MTKRLYYGDPYKKEFKSTIIENFFINDLPAVILNKTIFYPTSGGQPHDLGKFNDVSVIDVFIRDSDGKIVHLLDEEINLSEVIGVIDWERRFDHMQQHSGQHILSRAFVNICGANTTGFHLGKESCTIDLDATNLNNLTISKVELLANQVVWEDRPIRSREVSAEEARSLDLRKVPDSIGAKYRIVDIVDFDRCACGGTHVARSGEIGVIKVIGTERRNKELRIEFICGQRALVDYQKKNSELKKISSRLTTGIGEIDRVVESLQNENKGYRRRIKKQSDELLSLEANSLLENADWVRDLRLVKQSVKEENSGNIRSLASKLVQQPHTLALLATPGNNSVFVFAASKDIDIDMNKLLKQVFAHLGAGNGGGTDKLAQGGGPTLDEEHLVRTLDYAEELIKLRWLET